VAPTSSLVVGLAELAVFVTLEGDDVRTGAFLEVAVVAGLVDLFELTFPVAPDAAGAKEDGTENEDDDDEADKDQRHGLEPQPRPDGAVFDVVEERHAEPWQAEQAALGGDDGEFDLVAVAGTEGFAQVTQVIDEAEIEAADA
jgi:hypothetical protein